MQKKTFYSALSIFFVLFLTCGCNPPYGPSKGQSSCKRCHKLQIDSPHKISCQRCHKGNPKGQTISSAHEDLIRHPASFKNAPVSCGPCHGEKVLSTRYSLHYTLKNEISTIWKAFFPNDTPPKALEIKGYENPRTKRELIIDLLAKRCLRCHVYYRGDDYSGTKRGLGCAACHLGFTNNGKHVFHRPIQANCLSCHYGNYVGWDYAGRFEKDFPEDFRAPFKKGEHVKRPYGLEWIEMSRDIHAQKGLTCTDCHKQKEFHPKGPEQKRASCRDCHKDLSKAFGHQDDAMISCAACHAKWGFYDYGKDILRLDAPDMDDWDYLRFQGSSEIEKGQDFMLDKLNHVPVKGIWIMGLEKRRWWPVILGIDSKGKIEVIRPLLDISISYMDSDEEMVFEDITPSMNQQIRPILPYWYLKDKDNGKIWASYFPHTLGKPDIFRTLFIKNYSLNQKRGKTR